MTIAIGIGALALALLILAIFRKPTEHRLVIQLPKPNDEVLALIDQRRKLEAVKLYRTLTNTSLLEAKRVVDHYALMRGAAV